jgi:5'-phosphate synthase pdxT subunit
MNETAATARARPVRIGVLALQGAFREHIDMLGRLGVDAVAVRLPTDLEGIAGLILPGGESTTLRKLLARWGLRQPILKLAGRGAPIFGTCAGMILLATEITDGDEPVLPLLDISVKRNAFGRQLDSFEADFAVPVLGDTPVHGVFIRAPIVERVGDRVDVLAQLDDGRVVAVRRGNVIATAFHPELAGETRFHRLVATMAAEFAEPGEGSGRRRHPIRRDTARETAGGALDAAPGAARDGAGRV